MQSLISLKSVTLADGVENSLLSYIQNAKLQPGDMLPKEEDLATRLNVSRHIVREGISRLKTIGLIESRKRKGMVLSRPNIFAGICKLAEAKLFSKDELMEFMNIRIIMELGMAEFIYEQKTPELIADLRTVAGKQQSYQETSVEIAFHSKLFAIGGNKIANQFQSLLTTSFGPIAREWFTFDKNIKTPSHFEICEVLENGTKLEFLRIMREHFQPYMNNKL